MYKIDQIKTMFDCKFCSKLLVDPIVITCGSTVCLTHLKEFVGQKTYECKCCYKHHLVPTEGFVISEFIQNLLLRIELNKIEINPVYENCKVEIEEANKLVSKIEEINNDSENFIYNYFDEIKRKVDLRREILKGDIDKYSDEVIQSINETQAHYIKLSKETTELEINIENSKKELNKLIKEFDTLKIDEKKFHNIADKVVALNQVFKDNLIELKSSLIGHHEYSLDYEHQTIADIFGIITETNSKINSIILNGYLSIKLLKLCEFPVEQKWDLLYRASRDGFDTKDFHSKCDGKKNTLTIIKTTNGNIFGGYTDQAWNSFTTGQWYPDKNAFIFSLVNKNNKPFKAEVNQNSTDAIYCDSSYGPTFGGGFDFNISSNSNTNQSSYSSLNSILAGSYDFQTVEIEVFAKIIT